MKIKLSQIKASPNPIRKSWDQTKMDELRWSLMEEGQVEPIGVHENGTGYTIVWGHRRVQAARLAGWDEIETVVVPQDEVDNLIQAGIENLAGEDMSKADKADWAYRLNVEFGMSIREISRRSTVPMSTISDWLVGRRETAEWGGVSGTEHYSQDEGSDKTVKIARILGDDIDAKKAVAAKVSEDRLTEHQTAEIARAYRDAPTPEIKAQVLKAPVVSRDTAADILRRSINRVEMETGVKIQEERSEWQKERDQRQAMQEWDFAVKDFLDFTKRYSDIARKGQALVKYGKYSPEAARFTIRKIDALIDDLKNYREALEGVV